MIFFTKCSQSNLVLWAAILQAPQKLLAHRSLPQGVTCGSQFSSPDDALTIPNTEISWASYHIFDCDDPIFWLEAQADAGQMLKFTVTVPVLDRFEDARFSVAFLHSSLPDPERSDIPDGINNLVAQGHGAVVFDSPSDQSTCDHLQDMMTEASSVVDNRCHFYEPFGGSNSWVVLDQEFEAVEAGVYKIAVYNAAGTPAKAAFACCDWPEDFITDYDFPETTCPYCGTNELENAAWSSHFYEQKSMTPYAGFPPAISCSAPESKDLEPTEEQCPPLPKMGDPAPQPASCNLGCSMDGECHSHNVFGECTHFLDWSLEPKFGDAPVKKLIIFKGDKIKFSYEPNGQLAHNLFDMKDDVSLETCNFNGATNLAGVEEIFVGHTITFDEVGTYHFSCSIGCSAGVNSAEAREGEGGAPELCHCKLGQKLTVEVKDATEGLKCHEHKQSSLSAEMEVEELKCANGEMIARAVGKQDFGAMNEYQCAEFCLSAVAFGFMQGVEKGSCVDEDFIGKPEDKTVQPPGSPSSMQVRITSKMSISTPVACADGEINAYAVENAEYGATGSKCAEFCTTTMALNFIFMSGVEEGSCVTVGYTSDPANLTVQPAGSPQSMEVRMTSKKDDSTCHCHSYEEIACPEVEEPSDTLYAEHIDEIETHCVGILNGTDETCPYKCFQPMEVLHLHYLECMSRDIDPTYLAVNATNKCHIAATAPEGAECPKVTLGRAPTDEDDPNDIVPNENMPNNKPTSGVQSMLSKSSGWGTAGARIIFAAVALLLC